jgi:aldose 1-epimerase
MQALKECKMIKKEFFGNLTNGTIVNKYTIIDGKRELVVLDLGGIIQSLKVPDNYGNYVDVVLGYDSPSEYYEKSSYLGAAIGRYGNRIENGKMSIDGTVYNLYLNNGNHHLHGGKNGFNHKIFDVEMSGDKLTLKYFSKDLEENYPGNLNITIKYTFRNNELKIEYFAKSDKKTAVNLTNHSYFNLNGVGSGDILKHKLMIDADYVTPTDAELIPHGEYLKISKTSLDFKYAKEIGKDINDDIDQLQYGNGYDINYVLNGEGFRKCGYAIGDKSGILMELFTDKPGVQLYTGNHLNDEGKGFKYNKNYAFCLETQFFPNGVNYPEEYKYNFLDKDELYHYTTIYKFKQTNQLL